MKFSTKSRYALRLMLDIANVGEGGYVPLRDVSERQGISVKYLEQIVPQLAKAGLVKSSRGPRGGYGLAVDASKCTPGDVIRAVEGNIAVVACLGGRPNACERAAHCPTLGFWERMNTMLDDYLDSMTLRTMVSFRNPPGKDTVRNGRNCAAARRDEVCPKSLRKARDPVKRVDATSAKRHK
jgi:Rrf2 family protein